MSVQLLAILVTDLVGSTATRVEVGEDRAEELRREHDAMVRSVVEACAGTVVKSTGDGVLAFFSSAVDAIAAAVAVQRRLGGLRVSSPDGEWAMRVGVSVGDVTVEDGDVYGAPVIEASRLCAAAEAGEILATGMVQLMSRGRAGDVFAPRGELTLKGLPDPVTVCAVRWDAQGGRIPLPALLVSRADVELVGREPELARLTDAWEEALAGRVSVALVSGEPGIGKTRLVSEFARTRHADGALVLAGRCDEELGVPFEPFAEALGHLVAQSSERELRAQLGGSAALIGRVIRGVSEQLPDLEPVPPADPEIERAEFVDAVIGWLAETSGSAPVVLMLDDLHWADSPSLSLLRALARDRRPARVLVLGTYREVELSRRHPLSDVLADLRRETPTVRLALHGLPEAEVASLVEILGDDELVPDDKRLTAALTEATDGNPFFVLEMIRHLNENEWQVRASSAPGAEHAAARFSLPEGVREVIGKRLARLTDAANRLLQVAAVIGRGFELALLVDVTELTEAQVLELVAEGMAARLVAEVPGAIDQFEFTHALIQETLRTEVPTSVRVRLHRRIADAIVKLGGGREGADVGALAFHYSEAASSGCVDEAVAYAQRAAEQSMQSLAFEDALLYLERGLTVASLRDEPDPAERAALQLASANAYYALRDEDRARQAALMAIDAAREARPPAAAEFGAAANLVWQLGTYGPPVEYELGRALVEEALEVVGDELVSTRIQLLDVLAANGGRAFPALVAYSTEAVALARATSDPRLLADALSAQAFVHGGPDSVEECRGIVNEVAALALDDPRGPLLNFEFRFMVRTRSALRDGHIMEFRAIIEEVRALSRRSAHPDARYLPRLWDGLRLRLEGAWSEAEARAQDAVDSLSGFDQTFALTHQFVQLVPIRAAQGRLDELEPLQAAFTGMNPILEYQCMLANTHACLGRTPEAHDRIAEIVDRHLDGIDRHSELWFAATSQLADACVMVGDEPRAQVLYDRMADVTDIIIVNSPSGCDGSFDRVLGRLAGLIGRWDDADTHFATGRALEERLQSPPLVARTDLHQAEMLLRARRPGDAARAEQLLSAAHATAVRLDMHDLLHDIETLRDQ